MLSAYCHHPSIPGDSEVQRDAAMSWISQGHTGLNYSEVTVGIVLLHRMAFFKGRIRRVFFSSLTQTNTIDRMSSPLGEKMKWCTNGNDGEVSYMSRTILWRKKKYISVDCRKKRKKNVLIFFSCFWEYME